MSRSPGQHTAPSRTKARSKASESAWAAKTPIRRGNQRRHVHTPSRPSRNVRAVECRQRFDARDRQGMIGRMVGAMAVADFFGDWLQLHRSQSSISSARCSCGHSSMSAIARRGRPPSLFSGSECRRPPRAPRRAHGNAAAHDHSKTSGSDAVKRADGWPSPPHRAHARGEIDARALRPGRLGSRAAAGQVWRSKCFSSGGGMKRVRPANTCGRRSSAGRGCRSAAERSTSDRPCARVIAT